MISTSHRIPILVEIDELKLVDGDGEPDFKRAGFENRRDCGARRQVVADFGPLRGDDTVERYCDFTSPEIGFRFPERGRGRFRLGLRASQLGPSQGEIRWFPAAAELSPVACRLCGLGFFGGEGCFRIGKVRCGHGAIGLEVGGVESHEPCPVLDPVAGIEEGIQLDDLPGHFGGKIGPTRGLDDSLGGDLEGEAAELDPLDLHRGHDFHKGLLLGDGPCDPRAGWKGRCLPQRWQARSGYG
jgi:hypothetical protein